MEEARKKKWGSVALIIGAIAFYHYYDLLYSYFKSQHVKQIIMALKIKAWTFRLNLSKLVFYGSG